MTRLLDRIRSSFWFVPVVMALGAVGLALGVVALDELISAQRIDIKGWVYSGGAEGASAVLGTIAGSMITIAGVVFSLTLVALSLAATQLGPRVLSSFMRDRSVQVVLGTFIATFLYCLLVLRTVRRVEEDAFVPQVAVSVALVMAVLSLGVLIYFVHHVSISIQADEIISRISRELVGGIDGMYPDGIGTGGPPVVATPGSGGRRAITAPRDGYVQIIEAKRLLQAAATHDVVVVLTRRPGHYVIAGSPIAEVSPGGRVTEEVADAITTAIVIGGRRSPAQDVEFSINQLVEIAVRALSPGVNDPFTAIACVDRLGSALCRVGRREPPASQRRDDQGVVRVIAEPLTFGALADAAFNQIRQTSVATVAVTIRLLETITAVAACLGRDEDRAVLRRHADMIVAGAREAITEAADRLDVEGRYLAAVDALAARTGTLTNHGFVE